MKEIKSVLPSLASMAIGCALATLVLFFWRPHYAGALTWAVGSGFAFGIVEVELIGRMSSPESKLFRLDGMIFPFFSLGIAAAVVLCQSLP